MIVKTGKDNCKVSVYGEVFQNVKPKRGPFHRPKDLLVSKGNIEFETTKDEDFVQHPLPEWKPKEPEKYVPPPGKMDVDSEYHSHFLGERAQPAKIPPYLKTVTQMIPSGKIEGDTTNRADFKLRSAQARCMPVSRDDKYTPPKSPFTHTSIHRADFLRFNQPKRATGRQPDKIDMKGHQMHLDTSHSLDFKRYSIVKNKVIRRGDEYQPPSGPFDSDSLMRTDYQKHSGARKADIHNPIDTVFKTDERMERMTTNLEDFKTWPVEAVKSKHKQKYEQPEGEMVLKSTSMDYRYFGNEAKPAKSARPKTKLRTGRDGVFNGTSNYSNDFKVWASLPALPIKAKDELIELSPRRTKFDSNSEHREEFRRFNTAPARIFKPLTSVFKTDESMASKTVYNSEFAGRQHPTCPSERILGGEIAGMRFEDDEDTGHRYVIGKIRFGSNDSGIGEQAPNPQGRSSFARSSSVTGKITDMNISGASMDINGNAAVSVM